MSLTTYLMGGCANQLFQYSVGLAQARRLNTELLLDVTSFKSDPQRRYNLDLFSGVNDKTVLFSRPTIQERQFNYDPELVESIKDGDVLHGYWQSEKYFESVADEIYEKIKPRQAITDFDFIRLSHEILRAGDNSTFLLIRRGDYLQKLEFHGVLGMDYYDRALEKVAETCEPELFIFSDEPEWVNKNFQSRYKWQVAGSYNQTTPNHLGREDIDLYLMSLCYNAVLANSSFAWWGAWLGDRNKPGRTVIAPKRWFTTPTLNTSTLIPARWTQI